MPADRVRCPECRALIPLPDDGRSRFRCPYCEAWARVERSDDDALQTEPVARRRPTREDDEGDRPARRVDVRNKRAGGGLPLALGLGAVVIVGLLLICGGVGVLLLWDRSPSGPGPVAAFAEAAAPGQPAPLEPIAAPGPKEAAAAGAGGSLPPATLEALKKASVFIKVEAGGTGGSGSGFAVRTVGTTVYVVTNHHVIAPRPDEDDEDEDDLFPPGFPRPPVTPFRPRFPRAPRFGPGMGRPAAPTLITVVFNSGTSQEQSLRAEVIADEAETDLAVLRVPGVAVPPRPIDATQAPPLTETMPIFAFGFPFGRALAGNPGNPAITVTKGAVSSLRNDAQGELSGVQIDGDLNPGNSGGPIVDGQGRLIGVAKAKVINSKIGMAVPYAKVQRLLNGLAAAGRLGG